MINFEGLYVHMAEKFSKKDAKKKHFITSVLQF